MPDQSHNLSRPRTGQTNASLPAAILLGSLISAYFLPLMLLFATGSLIWLVLTAYRRQRAIDSLLDDQEQNHLHLETVDTNLHRLSSVINATDIPIIATDSKGIITDANPAAQNLLSPGRTLAGTAFDELITNESVLELASHALGGEAGHARFTLPVHGQSREFDVAGDPIGSGLGCVFSLRDITQLTTAVSLKADFAANASHELRTPIASIRGAIDTLEGPASDDEPMRNRMIEMISNNATRLELLVDDLLDLSKLESSDAPPDIERIDVEDLVARISEELAQLCGRRSITIEFVKLDPIDSIASDRSLLTLILRNLIENATKFARESTTITVSMRSSDVLADADSPIPAGLDRVSGVIIEVADRGVGIPLGDQQRIFERFYQVNDARSGSSIKRGTGLGLAIVKHSCKRLGGSIRLESVLGEGTTMTVALPRCADRSE